MSRQRIPQSAIVLMLITAFLTGCGAPVAQPAPPPTVAATASPALPPTAAPTVQPAPSPTAAPTARPTLPPPSPALDTVWGSSGSDVFAAGDNGAMLHYDGHAWSPMSSGTQVEIPCLWGSMGSDVFAVGFSGTILHYDGSAWSPMKSGTPWNLIGVWGTSAGNVFAVGGSATILHYDGSAWSPMRTYAPRFLISVWGSSDSDVFAVGEAGTILHYDGSAWSPMKSGTYANFEGVWGSSGSDVFAAGDHGTILHYDGSAWSPVNGGTTDDLVFVWGSSLSDVFAVGAKGTILHYDGSAWSPMNSSTSNDLESVWGSSGSDVFAVGGRGTILHYDGKAWAPMSGGGSAATPVSAAPAGAATPASAAAPAVQATPSPQPWVQSIHDKITSQALAGNLLGDPAKRTVYVLLPPGYETSGKRYPVVYVMPGGDGEPSANAMTFHSTMNLLPKGEINEMIVVVPDGTNKLGASQFRSSPTIGDYETYVSQEVVNYVDAHYRTLPARESRGLAGCSNGGSAAMRLALKYPNVFSVVAATDGSYDDSLEVWPSDVEAVQHLKELPRTAWDLGSDDTVGWYVQAAAGTAPDPNNPPFYCEMPFRIVNGQGEFVPEVIVKIVDHDAAHEARRYVQQPVRLRGIFIRHGLDDTEYAEPDHRFEKLLTDLGIEHQYVEEKTGHCGTGWEAASLKFMSDKLAFEEQ